MKEKLVIVLDKYIKEYKNLKEEYENKRTTQTLYEELINLLEEESFEENKLHISILLSSIYKDDIYLNEFLRIMIKNDKNMLDNFIRKIRKEFYDLKLENRMIKIRLDRSYEMFASARRVKANIKYQTPISKHKNDIYNTKRIIGYFEKQGLISNKEELLLINEIEIHNRKVVTNRRNSTQEQEYTDNLYNEIPNILRAGFQEHDVIEVPEDRKKSLNKLAMEIKNLVSCSEIKDINKLLESYEIYGLESSEYNYIIVEVLNEYLEELITLYELLIDKEVYRNRYGRVDVIQNYYQTLEKYLIVKKYYDKVSAYKPEEKENDELVEETQKEKILIYSHSNVTVTKTKFISDMNDIPYEYYDTVYELITNFKNGTLQPSEYKALKNNKNLKGYTELRYDQVRIILKHVKDNIYNVQGVFAKKDDNDIHMYTTMANRMIPDISTERLLSYQLELAEKTEEELKKLVQEKGRKGTR